MEDGFMVVLDAVCILEVLRFLRCLDLRRLMIVSRHFYRTIERHRSRLPDLIIPDLASSFEVLQSLLRSNARKKSRDCTLPPADSTAATAAAAGVQLNEHIQGVVKRDPKEFILRLLCHCASLSSLGQSYTIQPVASLSTLELPIVTFDEPDQMTFTLRVGPAFHRLYRLAHGSPQRGAQLIFSTLAAYLTNALCQAYWFEVAGNDGPTTRGWTLFGDVPKLGERIRQACREALRNAGSDGAPAAFNLTVEFNQAALKELLDNGVIQKAIRAP